MLHPRQVAPPPPLHRTHSMAWKWVHRQFSNIKRTKSRAINIFSFRLVVLFAQSIEAMCWVENTDVVGTAPTGVMLQLHLSNQQFHCLLRCVLYYRHNVTPIQCQAIIWTNAGLLFTIVTLGTNFSETLINIKNFSFTQMYPKYRLRNGGHFVQEEMS